jgi:hypothetical protein
MVRKLSIIFTFVLCFLISSESKAQSITKNGKIPKDLVITFESYGRFCNSESKIKSDGKLLMNLFSCLPLSDAEFDRYESAKKYKKLPKEKIMELILEFEKVNFFNLNDEYSTRKDSCSTFITDAGSTKISIQINGKTKQIFFENGCVNEKNTVITQLKNLGEKINQIQSEVKISKLNKTK